MISKTARNNRRYAGNDIYITRTNGQGYLTVENTKTRSTFVVKDEEWEDFMDVVKSTDDAKRKQKKMEGSE